MISRTLEYALRAAVWLAGQDAPRSAEVVARATQTPPGYAAKVLQTLVEAGLARSQRGLGGGFVLARPGRDIRVLDVVNAVEPIARIRSCPLKLGAHQARLCPLHRKLDEALAAVEAAFASTSIDELQDPRGRAALCEPDAATESAPRVTELGRPNRRSRPGGVPRTRRGG